MPKVVHFEVPADDPERARSFYTTVFGWTFDTFGDEGYWLADSGEPDAPGAEGALTRRSEVHHAPVIVVGVASVDDCLATARQAGAELLTGKQTIPSIGFSAYFRDTEGNVVGIFEPAGEGTT